MDRTDLAFARLKRKNRLLFLPNDPFLQELARALGLDEGRAPVEARRQAYLARLAQARAACGQDAGPWAGFLLR